MKSRPSSVWEGYFLSSPVRRLFHDPEKILKPFIFPGMTVLDVGCGMGFFSLVAARLAGVEGRVIAMDLQPKMIEVLNRRAARAGVSDRIEARVTPKGSLGGKGLAGSIDLALAFNVVHEVSDRESLMAEIHEMLVPKGRLLLAEARAHVSDAELKEMEADAEKVTFLVREYPSIKGSRAVLLEKD